MNNCQHDRRELSALACAPLLLSLSTQAAQVHNNADGWRGGAYLLVFQRKTEACSLYTLNLKSITSPSRTTYSLPSIR
jgi:hypothetical protein